jgi:hypothetical protein
MVVFTALPLKGTLHGLDLSQIFVREFFKV